MGKEGCSKPGVDCTKTKCCYQSDMRCYEKNQYFASCQTSCTPGHVDTLGEKWSCKNLEAVARSGESKGEAPNEDEGEEHNQFGDEEEGAKKNEDKQDNATKAMIAIQKLAALDLDK